MEVTRALVPIALVFGVGVPFSFLFPDYYLRRLGLPAVAELFRMRSGVATQPAGHRQWTTKADDDFAGRVRPAVRDGPKAGPQD